MSERPLSEEMRDWRFPTGGRWQPHEVAVHQRWADRVDALEDCLIDAQTERQMAEAENARLRKVYEAADEHERRYRELQWNHAETCIVCQAVREARDD